MTEWLLLLAAVLLTAITGVFVAAEFYLTTVDRGAAEEAAQAGDPGAAGVVKALRGLSTELSAAQLGITLTTLVVGFLAEPALGGLIEPVLTAIGLPEGATAPIAVALGIALATFLQMILGELGPKNLAIARPLRTAALVAPGLRGFTRVTGPAVRALQAVANGIVRRLGIEPREELDDVRGAEELGAGARRRPPPVRRGGRPVPHRRPAAQPLPRAAGQVRHRRDDPADPAVDAQLRGDRGRRHRRRHPLRVVAVPGLRRRPGRGHRRGAREERRRRPGRGAEPPHRRRAGRAGPRRPVVVAPGPAAGPAARPGPAAGPGRR